MAVRRMDLAAVIVVLRQLLIPMLLLRRPLDATRELFFAGEYRRQHQHRRYPISVLLRLNDRAKSMLLNVRKYIDLQFSSGRIELFRHVTKERHRREVVFWRAK
jgi:hypothetical protein